MNRSITRKQNCPGRQSDGALGRPETGDKTALFNEINMLSY